MISPALLRRSARIFVCHHRRRLLIINSMSSSKSSSAAAITRTDLDIPVPWGKIACQVWKPAASSRQQAWRNCLLLHGWQDNSNSFLPLMDHIGSAKKSDSTMASDFHFVAPDLPGHGMSSHRSPGAAYHFADYLVDVRRIVLHLRWTSYCIIGHSMGGGIGQLYTACYPNEVQQLALIDFVKPLSTDPYASFRLSDNSDNEAHTLLLRLRNFVGKMAEWQDTRSGDGYTFDEALKRYTLAFDGRLSDKSVRILLERNLEEIRHEPPTKKSSASASQAGKLYRFRRDRRLQIPSALRISVNQLKLLFQDMRTAMLIVRARQRTAYEPGMEEEFVKLFEERLGADRFRFALLDGFHHLHMDRAESVARELQVFFAEHANPPSKAV